MISMPRFAYPLYIFMHKCTLFDNRLSGSVLAHLHADWQMEAL